MSGEADGFQSTQGRHGPIWKIAKGVRVYKSPDGTFEVEVPEGGKRKRRRVEELESAIEAAKLFALRAGLRLYMKDANDLSQGPYLFEHAARDWFALNKGSWESATIEKYRGLLKNHILPAIGNLPLSAPYERCRERVKKCLVDLREIRSAKMVEVAHAVISGVFSEAIDSARVQINPAQGLLKRILPSKRRRVLSKPDPFSKADLQMVLDSVWKVLSPDRAMAIEVMAKTGMRVGECLAMHVDNLDIQNRLYWIKEKVRHGKWGLPKAGEDRKVDLSEELMGRLQAHLKRLKERMLAEGKTVGYLFPGVSERMMQAAVRRACQNARVRVRTPHDLRHTYATLLLMDHVSPAYVQRQLGHHSITMTVDIYGHWLPGEGKPDLDSIFKTA